ERSKAKSLALGGDDDGVRRVDVERDALWRGVVVVDQLDALGHELAGPVDALLRSRWIGREEQVAAVLVEPELVAGLGPRDRAQSLEVDAAREHRHSTPRARPSELGRLRSGEAG